MNPADDRVSPGEEAFDRLVTAYHESLAAGDTPAPMDETLPAPLVQRVRRAQACLALLESERRALSASRRPAAPQPHEGSNHAPKLPIVPRQFGRFRIERELGRGGYGVVFLAHDDVLRRKVALKVPRPEVVVADDLFERFLREAQVAGSLAHPNLVPVYEVRCDGPFSYIASAYCEGPTLEAWLKDRAEPAPFGEAAKIVAELA